MYTCAPVSYVVNRHLLNLKPSNSLAHGCSHVMQGVHDHAIVDAAKRVQLSPLIA